MTSIFASPTSICIVIPSSISFSAVATLSFGLITITDRTGTFSTLLGVQTYGYLKVESNSVGTSSTIAIVDGTTGTGLIGVGGLDLTPPTADYSATILTAVRGEAAGVQNDPVTYANERERLLTHIIFSPVLKSANRTLTITYTLTVSVARTVV